VKSVAGAIARKDIPPDCVGVDAFGRTTIVDMDRALEAMRSLSARPLPGRPAVNPLKLPDGVNLDDSTTWPRDQQLLKTIREHWQARQAMLKNQVLAGGYVPVEQLRLEVFGVIRVFRDRVQTLGETIKADLAAELGVDAERAREVIDLTVERWLDEMAKALEAKCSGQTTELDDEKEEP
jgi:hypothetical protein